MTGCCDCIFEPVGKCVEVFLLCEAHVLGVLFRSGSIVIGRCLTDEPAGAVIPLTISLRACLFDLICFDFLRGATVVLHLISGAS